MKNKKLDTFKKCICGKPAVVSFESVMSMNESDKFKNNNYCGKLKCFLTMNWVPKIAEKLKRNNEKLKRNKDAQKKG